MRRVRYQVAASLDGYIAGPQGEADWIPMDPDIDFGALFKQFDTLLMGRRTYEGLEGQGGAGMFSGMKVVVASRTLKPADHPKVKVVSSALAEAVAALREEKGKDIWLFGGGALFRQPARAGPRGYGRGGARSPSSSGAGSPCSPPPRRGPASPSPVTASTRRRGRRSWSTRSSAAGPRVGLSPRDPRRRQHGRAVRRLGAAARPEKRARGRSSSAG